MAWGAPDPLFEGWDRLDWQERRRRRFARWLAAPGVEFETDAVRDAYQGRVQLLIDALDLKKPARVPVSAAVGFYVGKHSGLTKKESMHDYEKMSGALVRYHEDFRPDFQARPVAPAGVFERLGLEFVDWPGHGLSDETPWQYLEAEYMKAEEYDALIADPENYFRRALLPRFGSAFATLAALGPFSDLMEAASMPFNILPFADPAWWKACSAWPRPRGIRSPGSRPPTKQTPRPQVGWGSHRNLAALPKLRTTSSPTPCAARKASWSTASGGRPRSSLRLSGSFP